MPVLPALPVAARRPPITLNLIGSGRVGLTLTRLWLASGQVQLQAVLNRDPAHSAAAVQALGAGQAVRNMAAMPPATLTLIAVPDTAIAAVAQALADAARSIDADASPSADTNTATTAHTPAPIALHASGFLPAAALAPLAARGWAVASAHPALSFAEPARAAAQFPGSACALEGDAAACALAESLLTAIGGRCFALAAADKPLYHGAAVFASNFAPVLQQVAAELWRGTGMPEALIEPLWQGFTRQVTDNLLALGTRAALTGPAARGDAAVLQAQAAAMQARDEALGQAYAALSTLAGRLARDGVVLPPPRGD